jgi:hypothetical protein
MCGEVGSLWNVDSTGSQRGLYIGPRRGGGQIGLCHGTRLWANSEIERTSGDTLFADCLNGGTQLCVFMTGKNDSVVPVGAHLR